MKKLTIFLTSIFFCVLITAQDKWQFGVAMGKVNYLGDLVEPSFTFDHSKFASGVLLRYQFKKHINLRSTLLIGNLVGDDANYMSNAARMASFKTSFFELSLLGEYDLFHISGNSKGIFTDNFTPYAFGGLGFALIDSAPQFGSNSPEIAADRAAQFSDVQPVIPIGFGVKYNIVKNIIIGLEMGIHMSFTDYLDGISNAGNPASNDHFFSYTINAVYQFGNSDADNDGIVDKKDRCPNLPGPTKFSGCPDTDGDGLTDDEDECPKIPGKALLKGCPDSDDDGVPDFYDDCPNDPGIRRLGGCPDTDNDGIVDLEDNCPTIAGIPSLNGCPDADRDGIMDSKDACPFEPGTAETMGCPDRDNDGIIDKEDECPDQPGKPTTKGCPEEDKDKDGVLDRNDLCPELPGPISNAGCPVIEQEDLEVLDLAMTNVKFDIGSAELLPISFPILDKIAHIMKKYKGYHLTINGHTDNVGDPEDNRILSEERAFSCYDYLFANKVNPKYMSHFGYGGTRPISDNNTELGREKNRRVEFILKLD